MPGQNKEDTIIWDYLKGLTDDYPHRFMDVGGFHPTIFSNTRILVEASWKGVYVEPAPSNFTGFLNEYRMNHDIVLVNSAVAPVSTVANFYDSEGDALSSLSFKHAEFYHAAYQTRFRAYLTKTITWGELLDAIKIESEPISVLSLDVESLNKELFDLLPIERLLPHLRVFVVEHDGHVVAMLDKLSPFGFRQHHFNGENVIFVR
jgi:hypothetical protein